MRQQTVKTYGRKDAAWAEVVVSVGGPAILDSERYSLERATGGIQTIIRDSAGNANAMFVLPRFSYADLGMTADMGTGDVTAFDFGSGSSRAGMARQGGGDQAALPGGPWGGRVMRW